MSQEGQSSVILIANSVSLSSCKLACTIASREASLNVSTKSSYELMGPLHDRMWYPVDLPGLSRYYLIFCSKITESYVIPDEG